MPSSAVLRLLDEPYVFAWEGSIWSAHVLPKVWRVLQISREDDSRSLRRQHGDVPDSAGLVDL
jgi:hypothetical protein